MSEDEVASRWEEFLGEVRRQRISLGSMLESTRLIGIRDGAIRIACETDFEASSVQRNKDFLSGILAKVFGVPARIEAEISQEHSPGRTAPPSSSPASRAEDHPIIAAMKRELGAEPLE
jgi:hypothetical protein